MLLRNRKCLILWKEQDSPSCFDKCGTLLFVVCSRVDITQNGGLLGGGSFRRTGSELRSAWGLLHTAALAKTRLVVDKAADSLMMVLFKA